MLTIEDIARAEGYAKAAIEVQDRARTEVDIAYWKGHSEGVEEGRAGGALVLLVGALAGALFTGLIVWIV